MINPTHFIYRRDYPISKRKVEVMGKAKKAKA